MICLYAMYALACMRWYVTCMIIFTIHVIFITWVKPLPGPKVVAIWMTVLLLFCVECLNFKIKITDIYCCWCLSATDWLRIALLSGENHLCVLFVCYARPRSIDYLMFPFCKFHDEYEMWNDQVTWLSPN